jgi:hypothetical protein
MRGLAIIGFVLTTIGCRSHDEATDHAETMSAGAIERISPMGAPMPGVNPGDEMHTDQARSEVPGGIAHMHTVATIGASKSRPPGAASPSTRSFDKLLRDRKPLASKAPHSSAPRYDVPEPY